MAVDALAPCIAKLSAAKFCVLRNDKNINIFLCFLKYIQQNMGW